MWASRSNLMRLAMEEAGSHLRKVGVNLTEPVDVFRIITDMGIELMFRPLEKADGFFVPPTAARPRGGILINSRRPLSRQRYSGAHELCHFLRRDTARIEFISEEYGPIREGTSDEEVFADFFAGHFLMPPKLVTHVFRKLGLRKAKLDERDVYLLALCMRTSYEATCNQLANLEFVSWDQHANLKRMIPQRIKVAWAEGLGHRDIWPIDQRMNEFLVLPTVDDAIQIRLPETPSTGYVWEVEYRGAGLLSSYEGSELKFSSPEAQPGQTGERKFSFLIRRAGSENLEIFLRRPWEKKCLAAEKFRLRIRSTDRELVGHYAIRQNLRAA